MVFSEVYRQQVKLLLRLLPNVAEEACFALKGGTAINLFVRDMPRLSVDVDLTYLPVASRRASLAAIDAAMNRILHRARKALPDVTVSEVGLKTEKAVIRLLVRSADVQVKIEVTPVLRRCVFEPTPRGVAASVEESFGFAEMQVVSFEYLYAGKIVAALDRQHPRDLFDIRELLANEGVNEELRKAFVVYLLSHKRPMAELLAPRRKSIAAEFEAGFVGMTTSPVTVEDLDAARESMIQSIVGGMPEGHRRFLVSFERGEPQWNLLGLPGIKDLPAVRWREQNLTQISADARSALVEKLQRALSSGN